MKLGKDSCQIHPISSFIFIETFSHANAVISPIYFKYIHIGYIIHDLMYEHNT